MKASASSMLLYTADKAECDAWFMQSVSLIQSLLSLARSLVVSKAQYHYGCEKHPRAECACTPKKRGSQGQPDLGASRRGRKRRQLSASSKFRLGANNRGGSDELDEE